MDMRARIDQLRRRFPLTATARFRDGVPGAGEPIPPAPDVVAVEPLAIGAAERGVIPSDPLPTPTIDPALAGAHPAPGGADPAVADPDRVLAAAEPAQHGLDATDAVLATSLAAKPALEGELRQPAGDAATASEPAQAVPAGIRIAAAWSWRVIVIAILLLALSYVLRYLSEVTVPLAVAVLLAAMLAPVTNRLVRWGLPRGLAAAVSVIGGLTVITGALTLIGTQIVSQSGDLGTSVVAAFNQFVAWLRDGPLNLSQSWLNYDDWIRRLQSFLVDSQDSITTYATEIGTQVGHFLAGTAIVLFALFFFLYEGRTIFVFLLRFVPRASRDRVDHAAQKGWVSLSHYVRAVILVALVDAVGVFAFAFFLGVPLAPALAALVFIGAFVPIVGALVSGFVAVIVALVALGWVKALIMLGGIIVVMQVEGHLLQPFLLGRAVRLHALAVIIGIAVGVVLGGIVGALFAIPMLAFLKAFVDDLDTPTGQLRNAELGA